MRQKTCAAWIKHLFRENVQLASTWAGSPMPMDVAGSTPWSRAQAGGTVAIRAPCKEAHEPHLGERIPPELFEVILLYVGENSASYNSPGRRTSRLLRLRRAGWAKNDPSITPLQACSLVCHYWAAQCRRSLFSGATLIIGSLEDMEVFKTYITKGCPSPRLQPIHQLIAAIYLVQSYSGTQSFCHCLRALSPLLKASLFEELFLVGPVVDRGSRYQLDTPFWSIPPSIVTPPSLLPFHSVSIVDVHLPSARHMNKYVRHLTCAVYIRFEKLTWNVGTIEHTIPRSYETRQHRQDHVSISARACTDNIHLPLYAALVRPDCPLHALGDLEYPQVISLMSQLWQLRGDTRYLHHSIHWDRGNCINMGLHSKRQCLFTLQLSFDNGNMTLGPPTRDIHLSGFRTTFYVFDAGIDILAVIKLLRSFDTLRVIHFDFVDGDHAEETMAGLLWSEILAPPLRDCEFIFTPAKRNTLDSTVNMKPAVAMFDPTGYSWEVVEDIAPHLLKHPRSQRAIREANESRIRLPQKKTNILI